MESPPDRHLRRDARRVLLLWTLGWLLLASHAARPHAREASGGWSHRDACCAHANVERGVGEQRGVERGGPVAAPPGAHWHACHVLELATPGTPPVAVRTALVLARAAPRAPPVPEAHDVEEREPRHRLAPKGSPPVAADLAAAHV